MVGIIIGSVCGGLLLIFLVTLYFIYRYIFHSPRKGQNNDFRIEPGMDYQGTLEHLQPIEKWKKKKMKIITTTSIVLLV